MRTWLTNAKVVVTIAVVQTIIYLTINHNPLLEPRALPWTALDEAIPFWPWTIWLYFGFIAGEILLALFVRDGTLFRGAVIAYLVVMGASFLVHLFWPTYIVRPDPAPDGTFLTWAYRLLLAGDAPNSCFPSAHVCGPVVIFWAYWRDGRPFGALFLFVLLPIMTLSILTTKQHYIWDWLGGWAMGGIGVCVASLVPTSVHERA